ncbi:hypothetical protein EVAR_29541_1 [Eumeta japonica]|uniref:Uncharacterized protein n=1 Tax=Eumeta variegata TaxID=151549 RepID=A0A4C1WF00_EUMVA|nr:hypothetical protein EVAR_29541_1 [Eumeta japonica]
MQEARRGGGAGAEHAGTHECVYTSLRLHFTLKTFKRNSRTERIIFPSTRKEYSGAGVICFFFLRANESPRGV